MKHHQPLVSIIQIIYPGTHGKNLDKSIQSVIHQTYDNRELIIVWEKNEDELFHFAQYNDARIRFLRASDIQTNRKEFNALSSVSRNVKKNNGAKQANGEYIYFIDDDFVLDKHILSQALEKTEAWYTMIAVHNTSDPSISIWSKVRKFERDMYKYDTNNISCRFSTKQLFDTVWWFNETLVAGEDYDIHNRMLAAWWRIGFIDAEESHLWEPRSLWDIIKKHYYYGQSLWSSDGNSLSLQNVSPIRAWYLKHRKKFILNPGLALLFSIYQCTRFAAGFLWGRKWILFTYLPIYLWIKKKKLHHEFD